MLQVVTALKSYTLKGADGTIGSKRRLAPTYFLRF
jgi:hypothetical protein